MKSPTYSEDLYQTLKKLDLYGAPFQYRLLHVRQEPLIKACGVKLGITPTIIDMTAGFGQDSLLLAASGARVYMIEREPILQQWLQTELPYTENLTLLRGDTKELLPTLSFPIDIVYLDPMFPKRKKSAQVQKKMVCLQHLLGEPEDPEPLLNAALISSAQRIVLKRPRLSPPVGALKPTFSHLYRSCRFDVYIKPQWIPAK